MGVIIRILPARHQVCPVFRPNQIVLMRIIINFSMCYEKDKHTNTCHVRVYYTQ